MMWFRQMAQLSTTMSHAQSATAFHLHRLAKVMHAAHSIYEYAYLLDLEALFVTVCAGAGLGCLALGWRRVGHVYVGHDRRGAWARRGEARRSSVSAKQAGVEAVWGRRVWRVTAAGRLGVCLQAGGWVPRLVLARWRGGMGRVPQRFQAGPARSGYESV